MLADDAENAPMTLARTTLRRFLLRPALLLAPVWLLAPIPSSVPGARAAGPADMPGGACPGRELACAKAVSPLLLPDGTLWLAWTAGGSVSVARSADGGHSFDPAAVLDPVPRVIDNGPDARPKIIRDTQGRIVVAYSIFKDQNWNAQVLVSRSVDEGRSFSPPRPISDDPASQRFEALALLPSGEVFAAWLDKRGAAAAKRAGHDYAGAALAYAWSKDAGASFGPAAIAQENSCECCRLAVALTPAGQPAVLFRNVYDGTVRDHAVVTFSAEGHPGAVHRVSVDDYRIDGCPHHGPSLAITADGTYHATWFTNGRARQGLFYARSVDGGQSFSAPLKLAGSDRQASRPFVLSSAEGLWLAWKEFDGERTEVRTSVSHDDGQSWSTPQTIAQTADESDHPLLVTDGRGTFLSWMTRREGYRLMRLGQSS